MGIGVNDSSLDMPLHKVCFHFLFIIIATVLSFKNHIMYVLSSSSSSLIILMQSPKVGSSTS